MHVIVADVGGTWTRCCLLNMESRVETALLQRRYPNASSPGLCQVLEQFIGEADIQEAVQHLVVAVAGPVFERSCKMTNLPWLVDADELAMDLSISEVHLINDLYAAALGLRSLKPTDKRLLQDHRVTLCGPALLIGAGTGLGQAMLVDCPTSQQVFASEIGFAAFAPNSDFDINLLRYAWEHESFVNNETFLCADGLALIYRFLLESDGEPCTFPVVARAVTQRAEVGEPRAREAMRRFSAMLGSFSGNAVLSSLASSGVYLMGGLARAALEAPGKVDFLYAFNDKGAMSGYMQSVPVTVVTDDKIGLLGAIAWLRARLFSD